MDRGVVNIKTQNENFAFLQNNNNQKTKYKEGKLVKRYTFKIILEFKSWLK